MSKELKALKLAHAVEKQIMQDNFDKCKAVAELRQWRCDQADKAMEDLKCCGNCTYESGGRCFVEDDIIPKTCGNLRCESWESDLMTKSERWMSRDERSK
jgi:hypothetical protein